MAGEELYVSIVGDASKLKSELDKASGQVSNFSEKIEKIGKISTIAGTAVTGAFGAIVTKTAEAGDKFDKMSKRTGIAVEDLSSLAYAAEISGTNIDTVENSLRFLARAMDDTSKGVGESQEAFEKLGISVVDSEGNLRPTIDVMKEAATALAEMENETDKVAAATDIFGSRYGTQLLPLLKEGGEGIEELMNKAKDLGITMSTDAATKAAEFTDRMTDLKGSLAGAGRTIGDTLIPAIIPLVERVTEIVGKVSDWAEENPKLVETIVTLGARIGVIAAVGGPVLKAVSAFNSMSGSLKAIGTILTPPAGFVVAAIIGIVAIWKNWDKIVEYVSGFVEKIKNHLENLKTIAVNKVTDMIDWIIKKFEDLANLPKKMLQWGKNAITGFVDGIKAKMSNVTDAVKSVGNKIKDFLGFHSPPKEGPLSDSDTWMPNMMKMFSEGIKDNIPVVETSLNTFAGSFLAIFDTLKTDFKSNIVDPIVGYCTDNLANAIKDILSGADEFEWNWKTFWEGLKNILITAVSEMIAKLVVLASFSWLFNLIGLPVSWLGINKGGGIGYNLGGKVKKFQSGGLTDTVPAMLTPGEYVISKDMTTFIRRFQAIPQNLIKAISLGMPTPAPPVTLASGGLVGDINTNDINYGKTDINVYISGNNISNEIDLKHLATKVSNEIVRKLNQRRRY